VIYNYTLVLLNDTL